jgi:hypothetical protein
MIKMGRKKKIDITATIAGDAPVDIAEEWIMLNEQIKKDKAIDPKQKEPPKEAQKTLQNVQEVKKEEELNLFRRIGRMLLYKHNISSTEFKRISESQTYKTYEYKGFIKFLSFSRLSEWYKNKYLRGRMFVIQMQLRNGKIDMFTIRSTLPYFEHRGGAYFIDPDMAREDLHSHHNILYYHQDFAAPFKIEFNVKEIHDVLSVSDEGKAIDKAINPSTFGYVINSQVIEKLIKAHEMNDKLKLIMILVIINLLVSAVCVIMIGKSSGMF